MNTLGTGAAQLNILFQIGSNRTITVNFGQDISGWVFEFYLKANKGARVKELSLVSGSGITSPVYGDEEIDINFTSTNTQLTEGEYYYELRRTDLNVPLINGLAYLSFDAPDGDLSAALEITIGTETINLTVQTGSNGGGGTWGSITGTLSNQTDLKNALDAKQDDIQFQDEGVDVGTPGVVTKINFTGASVGLSLAGTTLTINITGGGGGGFNAATDVLTTITADPFNYPASANTIDVFAGRTRGMLQSIFGDYTLPQITVTNNLVLDGNSQEDPTGTLLPSPTLQYGYVLRGILGTSNYTYSNFGVGAQDTLQLIARQATTIAAFNGAKTNNFIIGGEIENDAFNNTSSSAADYFDHISDWYAAFKAAGFYTIARTSPLRADFGPNGVAGSMAMNTKIAAANALLLADPSSYDAIINVQALPRGANNQSSIGYTHEFTHFNTSLQDDVALESATIIRAELGQDDYRPPNFVSWDGNDTSKSMVIGSWNNYPIGLMANGMVSAEVQENGTFAVTGIISAPDETTNPRNRFAVNTNQAIGAMIQPKLVAKYTNDILSALNITASFDTNGQTNVITDAFRINKLQDNGFGTNLYRVTKDGLQVHNPSFTATTGGQIAIQETGTITGYTSGTFFYKQTSPAFSFAANSTSFVGHYVDLSSLNRGAFSNTTSKAVLIYTGSGATTNDIALELSAPEGTALNIPDHGGTGTAISVVSSTTSNGLAIGMTSSAGVPIVAYKTAGTSKVGRFLYLANSSLNALVDMFDFERPVALTAGGGYSFNYKLNTANGGFTGFRQDIKWNNAGSGTEKIDVSFNVVSAGSLVEAMKLSGINVTFTSLAGTGSRAVVADANGVLSAP